MPVIWATHHLPELELFSQCFPGGEIGYNGYALLVFDGPTLAVEYGDLEGTLLARERWRPTAGQLELIEFQAERIAP